MKFNPVIFIYSSSYRFIDDYITTIKQNDNFAWNDQLFYNNNNNKLNNNNYYSNSRTLAKHQHQNLNMSLDNNNYYQNSNGTSGYIYRVNLFYFIVCI